MSQVNIKGLVNNIPSKTNVYTPLIEAIVNSIQAIDASGRNDGKIVVTLIRKDILALEYSDDGLPEIISVDVEDNGVGFNEKNRTSFDTAFTILKVEEGGKGFGRFIFLKYFDSVKVKSTYKEKESFKTRNFVFGKNETEIIDRETNITDKKAVDTKTIIQLQNLKQSNFNKRIETIARKLTEKLLIYFIDEKYICPQIKIVDPYEKKEIVLNNYFGDSTKEIIKISEDEFELPNESSSSSSEKFQVKVFKIYYPDNQTSKISLVAHKREVTETPIQQYIPEFSENFFDYIEDKTRKDYMLKTYVLGNYLNASVSLERGAFNFGKKEKDPLYPISQEDIEKEAARITKISFPEEIEGRQKKKEEMIANYVKESAPWHALYIDSVDLSSIPYKCDEERIELELLKTKFQKEQEAKRKIATIIETNSNLDEKTDEILREITELGKSDLVHYVCNRKVVLDLFKKLLERDDDGSTKYEQDIHNTIFPMKKDTTEINYENHNLWLLDERLSFSEFISSDKKISKTNISRPDIVIFNKKVAFRSGDNEYSNPITIFEFKRPKRKDYDDKDDPIIQVGSYLDAIRAGQYELPKGLEKIKVNDCTPVYAYIVCDITDKIREFAKRYSMVESPDNEGFFLFHAGYRMYVEIISFSKLIKDANLRNKIFFTKLKI